MDLLPIACVSRHVNIPIMQHIQEMSIKMRSENKILSSIPISSILSLRPTVMSFSLHWQNRQVALLLCFADRLLQGNRQQSSCSWLMAFEAYEVTVIIDWPGESWDECWLFPYDNLPSKSSKTQDGCKWGHWSDWVLLISLMMQLAMGHMENH